MLYSLLILRDVLAMAPIPEPYGVGGTDAWLLTGVLLASAGDRRRSTFMIDHFDLSGRARRSRAARGAEVPVNRSGRPCSTGIVMHPAHRCGFLLAFWANARDDRRHLLFAES